jgi:hypothetical protein
MAGFITFKGRACPVDTSKLASEGLIGANFGEVTFTDNQRFLSFNVTIRDPDFGSANAGKRVFATISFEVDGNRGATIDASTIPENSGTQPAIVYLLNDGGLFLRATTGIDWSGDTVDRVFSNDEGEELLGIDITSIAQLYLCPMDAFDRAD